MLADVPQNAGYMVAAYVVVAVVVLGYAWSLWRQVGRAMEAMRDDR
jgi:ABC-type branched-subunit amino acid transport system permease subunit